MLERKYGVGVPDLSNDTNTSSLQNQAICNEPINPSQTRSSADAEGLHDMPQIGNVVLGKVCNKGITFKDTQGHYNCCY